MKKLTLTLSSILLTLSSTNLFAGEISCKGDITSVMADHPGCVDSSGKKQLAFQLNTGSPNWVCSGSDSASSLVLSSKMSKKQLTIYIYDTNGATCKTHIGYIKPNYMIINE